MRLTQSTDRSTQVVAEFSEIIGGAVGELTVGLGPHEFGRVELGRVGGKQVHAEPRVRRDELARDETPVNRTGSQRRSMGPRRDAVTAIPMAHAGRLAARRPGPAHAGNELKPSEEAPTTPSGILLAVALHRQRHQLLLLPDRQSRRSSRRRLRPAGAGTPRQSAGRRKPLSIDR